MRAHYKFWPKRLPHRITPPATSLWQNLAISALRYPDKPATVFFGTVLTWAQMKRAAELKHSITDPDPKIAITPGDLAAE